MGLDYLTLDRPAGTLSGGELQRVRLAAGLGSGLVGVCYVLDEPSIGLHPRDNRRLIDALGQLQSRGNTVVVVEHDETIMRRADWLVDLGPGAGRHGGHVVAQGTPEQIAASGQSLTGRYLAGVERISVPENRRRVAKTRAITIEGVTTNNLKGISVQFPLSALVCVTGVSGSGKSSLVDETLARALVRRLGEVAPKPGPHGSLRGASQIDKVVQIDQSPIGRTPRSNPATYTGVFDEIRKVFAGTRDARGRGYKSGRFSFNVKGGRCEECQGQGVRRIEMNFLPDLYVTCPVCEGKRFNRQTLEIRYRDRSIADVLDMRVEEAAEFFENFPAIARLIGSLQEVGLGYMTLGQSSTTLSGGEAQRIKLAAELSRAQHGQDALHPRRADHRPALRRRPQAAGRVGPAGGSRQHSAGDRAQPRRDQDGRLDHRLRARRRRSRRSGRRRRHAGRNRRPRRQSHGAVSESGIIGNVQHGCTLRLLRLRLGLRDLVDQVVRILGLHPLAKGQQLIEVVIALFGDLLRPRKSRREVRLSQFVTPIRLYPIGDGWEAAIASPRRGVPRIAVSSRGARATSVPTDVVRDDENSATKCFPKKRSCSRIQ